MRLIDRYLMRLAMIDRYEGHVTFYEGSCGAMRVSRPTICQS